MEYISFGLKVFSCFSLIGLTYGVTNAKSNISKVFLSVIIGVIVSYIILNNVFEMNLKRKNRLELMTRLYIYQEAIDSLKDKKIAEVNEALIDLKIMDQSLLIDDPDQTEYPNIISKRRNNRERGK